MTATQSVFERALALIDAANAEDPNTVPVDGAPRPVELVYSERMTDMLARLAPDADEVSRLAVRAQHVERWKSPRERYPEGRIGYLQWRHDLYRFHAERAAALLAKAGCDDAVIARVRHAVAKRRLKSDPDAQLVEDVAALVFLEHYLEGFVAKNPGYGEQKLRDIIGKTWRKMSPDARDFALQGGLRLPPALAPLVKAAVS